MLWFLCKYRLLIERKNVNDISEKWASPCHEHSDDIEKSIRRETGRAGADEDWDETEDKGEHGEEDDSFVVGWNIRRRGWNLENGAHARSGAEEAPWTLRLPYRGPLATWLAPKSPACSRNDPLAVRLEVREEGWGCRGGRCSPTRDRDGGRGANGGSLLPKETWMQRIYLENEELTSQSGLNIENAVRMRPETIRNIEVISRNLYMTSGIILRNQRVWRCQKWGRMGWDGGWNLEFQGRSSGYLTMRTEDVKKKSKNLGLENLRFLGAREYSRKKEKQHKIPCLVLFRIQLFWSEDSIRKRKERDFKWSTPGIHRFLVHSSLIEPNKQRKKREKKEHGRRHWTTEVFG